MAPRSNWKGSLKLSLVSASIAIYPATSSSEKVRFNTLNRATGNRLKRQMVDGVTGDVVESDEQVKGYAVGKDQFVMVEDDELANVAIESTTRSTSRSSSRRSPSTIATATPRITSRPRTRSARRRSR
jgi:DNA end-binding protein Ku